MFVRSALGMNDSFHFGGKSGKEFYNGAMFDFVRKPVAIDGMSKDANQVIYPAGRQLVIRSLSN